mmetsp:Transcript_4354/g.8708  ORF Transcript_4354/g.8708 Transcript_4354/m.8708 type:complete len:165 (+) Transcript_4354:158-652(+)
MADRYKVDQRAALFGSRLGAAARQQRPNPSVLGSAQDAAEMLEKENDKQIEELESKVAALKDVTTGIAQETSSSITFLDGLGLNFDKAQDLLKGTLGHLTQLTQQKKSRLCVTVLFFVLVFLATYILSRLQWNGRGDEPEAAVKLHQQEGFSAMQTTGAQAPTP